MAYVNGRVVANVLTNRQVNKVGSRGKVGTVFTIALHQAKHVCRPNTRLEEDTGCPK